MDARITKTRLSNLLSYDWLKIIGAIAAAVLLICVLFTTIATRAGEERLYKIYAYGTVSAGEDEGTVSEILLRNQVFSYDIADVSVEVFGTGQYSEAAYTARRMAGEGTVMFVNNRETLSEEEEVTSEFRTLIGSYEDGLALDVAQWLEDCESYLQRFFGEDWRAGTLDEEEAEACFLARNAEDNRYRSEEKRAQGIEDEKARLEKLRTDYIFLLECFENQTFTLIEAENADGERKSYAIGVGGLPGISDLFYYTYEEEGATVRSAEDLCMLLFRNDYDAGAGAQTQRDLRFETVSFLRYLAETYGEKQ